MIRVTTAIVQDTRIKKKDGTYAIKLRLTYNREQKYYPIGKFLTEAEWQTLKSGKHRNKKLKELEIYFAAIENKAVTIIDKMNVFSFPGFLNQFNTQASSKSSVLDALSLRRQKFTAKNSINTAVTFQSTVASIEEFLKTTKKKKLTFFDVTPEWLKSYEKWMLATGRSHTTIGIYLRNLRTVINQAVDDGLLPKENYPFKRGKYQIPDGKNSKKALSISDIEKLFSYTPSDRNEYLALNYWLFSYLCNGMNMVDIANLKFKNIKGSNIEFIRQKTKDTTKEVPVIKVLLLPEIQQIIDRIGNQDNTPENFIFPVFKAEYTELEKHKRLKQHIKNTNKYIRRIARSLSIDEAITTYWARHSYGTILKRSGAPIEFISEQLGHQSTKVTQHYLDSFEDEQREKYSSVLIPGKNNGNK